MKNVLTSSAGWVKFVDISKEVNFLDIDKENNTYS